MQCYEIYPHNLTYRESIKLVGAKPWLIPIAIAAKFLRRGHGRHVQVLQGGMIPCDPRTFPPLVWEHLGGRMRSFQELGFRSVACEAYSPPSTNITSYAQHLVSDDRRTYAIDCMTVVHKTTTEAVDYRVGFQSSSESGDTLITTDGREDWPAPPYCHRVYVRDTTFLDLLNLHEERLQERNDIRELPGDPEGMQALFARDERERYDYFRKRGIYGPLFPGDAYGNPIDPSPLPVPAGTPVV